jgi:glycosyltransferase involved in cell wall biosynthesis
LFVPLLQEITNFARDRKPWLCGVFEVLECDFKMLKILFVTNDFLPMIGGVSNHIDAIAGALADFGCDVVVFHVCYEKMGPEVEYRNGYKIIRFVSGENLSGNATLLRKGLRYVQAIHVVRQALQSLIVSLSPDVVHWHDYYHSSISSKFLDANGILFVLTNHASKFLEQFQKGALAKAYLKMFASHAHGVIGPSLELAEKSKLIGRPTCFIPNGVNEKMFKPTKQYRAEIFQKLGMQDEDKVVLAPRRLDPKNGLDVLLRSIPLIVKDHPNVKIIIAGGGDPVLAADYVNLAKSMNVEKSLIITGSLPHTMMPQYISSADLVVIPSNYEAVSLAALEALACGVPVIASNVGGLPYVVNETNGALFERGNHRELAEVICHHLSDWPSTNAKGLAARKSVLRSHTWKSVAEKTLNFYKTISPSNTR